MLCWYQIIMADENTKYIHLNEKSSSYQELEKKVKIYEKNNYVSLYKRSSRTIIGAIKQSSLAVDKIKEETKHRLKYYSIFIGR